MIQLAQGEAGRHPQDGVALAGVELVLAFRADRGPATNWQIRRPDSSSTSPPEDEHVNLPGPLRADLVDDNDIEAGPV